MSVHSFFSRIWASVNKANSSRFVRKVFTLAAGTAVAQLVGVLVSPVLTRLYSPEAFGFYGPFMSLIGIGSVFATWKYEQGLVVSNSKTERQGLFVLLVILSLFSLLFGWLATSIFSQVISSALPIYLVLDDWAVLLLLGLGLTGIQLSLRLLVLKGEAFRALSAAKVIQTVSLAVIQVGIGFVASGAKIGLPIGVVAALSFSIVYLGWAIRKNRLLEFSRYPLIFQCAIVAARRNLIYPKYMVWSALCNAAVPQIPILLLGFLFPPSALGQFFLAQRIVKVPFTLISQSMADANFQEGAAKGLYSNLKEIYLLRVRKFMTTGIFPFGLLFIVAPWVFPLIFGTSWKEAGVLTRLLLPGLYIQFVFTPFTPFFTVLKEQRVHLIWAIVRLTAIVLGVWLGILMGKVRGAAVGYSFAMAFSFLLQHFLLTRLLESHMVRPAKSDR